MPQIGLRFQQPGFSYRDYLQYCKCGTAVHFKFLIFVTVILMTFEGQTSLICKLEICLVKGGGYTYFPVIRELSQ